MTTTYAYSVTISPAETAVHSLTEAEYRQLVAQLGYEPSFEAATDLPDGVDYAQLLDGRKLYREEV